MTMADDLRREASDPTTPGERLRAIHDRVAQEAATGESRERLAAWAVQVALLRNPSLPLDIVRRALSEQGELAASEAWYNPIVPLLLQSEPSPDYARRARQVLVRLGAAESDHQPGRARTLPEVVALWAAQPPRSSGSSRARSFARHLAGLFGLPWPSP